jgi:hypothetical protein
MSRKLRLALLISVALGLGVPAGAASVSSTVKRVYVNATALSVHLVAHPGECAWGLLSAAEDSAYDRWISLAMMAYANTLPVTVEYDSASCRIISFAVGSL